MSWNWQKITKDNKNLPKFNTAVLLYEEKKGNKYATVGLLKSIDGNGCHWQTSGYNTSNDIFDMFNMLDTMKSSKDKFKPSHWCHIEIPKKD